MENRLHYFTCDLLDFTFLQQIAFVPDNNYITCFYLGDKIGTVDGVDEGAFACCARAEHFYFYSAQSIARAL
ncbi:hypothetical protein BpHYR1_002960 [Brachionus plicatilis]|uniref:Uncharacterized protein n=1 Tax=Brachionus plicatilis TaxID=10195 RepID=A0A3M7SGQ8_BRAPC|nr:hypothetical protein BpHYR1_002960 [Brachionus plicatilis]